MTQLLRHLIGGHWVDAPAVGESHNPSDISDIVAQVPEAGKAEVDNAVAAAQAAFPSWADATPEFRADILDRTGVLILERREALGMLLAREEGKTLAEAIGETVRAGRIFRYFAGEALRMSGRTLGSVRPGVDVRTDRVPVGVVALVTPWNFPIAIPAWKTAPALAFGNTVVMKPASLTPTTAAALAAILVEAGAPAGIFNVLYGGGPLGAMLVAHRDVNAVSFTGSQAVGAKVAASAVARGARVQLEMGGKNPLVVLDDADLDQAVSIALDGAFFQTGQRCTASSRLLVTSGIHAEFVEKLAAQASQLRVGHALAPNTQMGPAASAGQLAIVEEHVAVAIANGGEILSGGTRIEQPTSGYFYAPTLIGGTRSDMRINREEVFGPVAAVIEVADYDEALAIANSCAFGLSAGICTRSLRYAEDFRRRAEAGMVMVNLPTAGVDYHVPFGGTKASSFGPREQGFAAIEFYTQQRTTYSKAGW